MRGKGKCTTKNGRNFVRQSPKGALIFEIWNFFNKALFEKLAWRILTQEDSLLHKMLKSKYFPNTSFLSAGCPSTSSWIWKSIMWGWDLLQQGIRWRVGDGENIKVWSDPWIPTSIGFKPLQGHTQINPQLRVSDLIDQHHHLWNFQDLHHHFVPEWYQL